MRIHFLFLLFIPSMMISAQSGKYAGTKKSLIGKTFTDSRKIPGLAGWQYKGGSLITEVNDPESITSTIYKKSTTYIVVFAHTDDTAANAIYTIMDVLEVKNVLSTQHIMTGSCMDGANEAIDVTALTKIQYQVEFSKAIKAWRFNRDKRRLEAADARRVKCMNEGGD